MFLPKLKLSKELWEKIEKASEVSMCSSPEEWAVQILEREAEALLQSAGKGELSAADVDEIARKMQGLGYLE